MDYEKIKQWIIIHKPELVVGVCFVLMFFVGFGAGRYERENKRNVLLNQYTQYSTNKDTPATKAPDPQTEVINTTPEVAGAAALEADTTSCPIKGNISSAGRKVYHVKGGAFYDRTNPEQCFNTEAAAKQAGFVKSSR